MTPKNIFLLNEKLSGWWGAIAKGPDFPQVLAMARAELSHQTLNPDMLKGIQAFETMLLTIGDRDNEESSFPTPGMKHDLDIPKNRKKKKPDEK